ncbi:unnamed protein product [Cutaneotrichosporon oleaginosum]
MMPHSGAFETPAKFEDSGCLASLMDVEVYANDACGLSVRQRSAKMAKSKNHTAPARVSSERARAREDETEERRAVGRRRGGVTRDGPWDSGSGESGRGAGVQRAEKRCAGELPHPRTRTPLPENRHEPSARRYGTQLTPSPPQRHQACCHPALQVAQGCRPEGV